MKVKGNFRAIKEWQISRSIFYRFWINFFCSFGIIIFHTTMNKYICQIYLESPKNLIKADTRMLLQYFWFEKIPWNCHTLNNESIFFREMNDKRSTHQTIRKWNEWFHEFFAWKQENRFFFFAHSLIFWDFTEKYASMTKDIELLKFDFTKFFSFQRTFRKSLSISSFFQADRNHSWTSIVRILNR